MRDWLTAAVEQAQLAPDRIVIEVTERIGARVSLVARSLERLRADGLRLALDDVGTGNSGLELLTTVDADHVKIDRAIAAAAPTEPNARAVLMAMATFASQTGAFVIAEGVEDEETLEFLRTIEQLHLRPGTIIKGGQASCSAGRPRGSSTAPRRSRARLPARRRPTRSDRRHQARSRSTSGADLPTAKEWRCRPYRAGERPVVTRMVARRRRLSAKEADVSVTRMHGVEQPATGAHHPPHGARRIRLHRSGRARRRPDLQTQVLINADGTAPFDASAGPGLDDGEANQIVRTLDVTTFQVNWSANNPANTTPVLRLQLPPGGYAFTNQPSAGDCPGGLTVSPARDAIQCSMGPFNSGADSITKSVMLNVSVPATVTNGKQFRLAADFGDGVVSAPSESPLITISSAPNYDLFKSGCFTDCALRTPEVRTVDTDGDGTPDTLGFVYDYGVGLRTDAAGGKGTAQLAEPLTVTDDVRIPAGNGTDGRNLYPVAAGQPGLETARLRQRLRPRQLLAARTGERRA